MRRGLVIAVDGPSGVGKSTVSRSLAQTLGYRYVDTGAMYRAMGWKVAQEGLAPEEGEALRRLCRETRIELLTKEAQTRVLVDGRDVTEAIRTPQMSQMASRVSVLPSVRETLTALQREMGRHGAVVMEGRDIGTVVFPDADVKVYLDAGPEERARRRVRDLRRRGIHVSETETIEELRKRDYNDSRRFLAPLGRAEDAILLDTTRLPEDAVMARMLEIAEAAWHRVHSASVDAPWRAGEASSPRGQR